MLWLWLKGFNLSGWMLCIASRKLWGQVCNRVPSRVTFLSLHGGFVCFGWLYLFDPHDHGGILSLRLSDSWSLGAIAWVSACALGHGTHLYGCVPWITSTLQLVHAWGALASLALWLALLHGTWVYGGASLNTSSWLAFVHETLVT